MASKKTRIIAYIASAIILAISALFWAVPELFGQLRRPPKSAPPIASSSRAEQKNAVSAIPDTLVVYAKNIRQESNHKPPTYLNENGNLLNGYCHIFYERPLPSTDVGAMYIYMSEVGLFAKGIKQGEWDTYPPHDEIMHYSETYKDGLLAGPFVVYDQRSRVQYQTTFQNGNGLWKSFYSTGKLRLSGYYQNGLEQGIWREYNLNGTIKEDTRYEHGVAGETHTY